MQTTILDVAISEESKGNKKWTVYEITHKDHKGQNGIKKLLSFNMPDEVKDFLDELETPKLVDVISEKNDRGFWDWTDIKEATEVKEAYKPKFGKSEGGGKKGDWETAEERTKKQVFIVRQSSVSAAIEFMKGDEDGRVDTILEIADQFTNYVFKGFDGYLPEETQTKKVVKKSSAKMPEDE